jgi:hypothetical protein
MTFASAMQRAPLVTLINQSTGEVLEVQFNPSELKKVAGANYAKHQVPGLSYEPLQFINTKNTTFQMELFFETSSVGSARESQILDAIKFLDALKTPRATGALRSAGAPRTLLVWPNFITLSCVLLDVEYTFNRFNLQNKPCAFLAELKLEQISDVHTTSAVVRVIGDLQPSSDKETG